MQHLPRKSSSHPLLEANHLVLPVRATRPQPASAHSRTRMRQRSVEARAIDAVIAWGRPVRQIAGRTAWFLGHRHCHLAALHGEDIRRFAGTIVVEASDGTIVTVIRSFNTRKLRRGAR